eukprot:scaffold3007_cov157-Amphora_coffeaeformis.AAC.5
MCNAKPAVKHSTPGNSRDCRRLLLLVVAVARGAAFIIVNCESYFFLSCGTFIARVYRRHGNKEYCIVPYYYRVVRFDDVHNNNARRRTDGRTDGLATDGQADDWSGRRSG